MQAGSGIPCAAVLLLCLCLGTTALAHSAPASTQRPPKSTVSAKPFRDCPECPQMVRVPGGSFVMGAGVSDANGFIGEGPQRKVMIRGFAVGKFDVTRAEWKAFVDATGRSTAEGCAYSQLPPEEKAKASWQHLGFPQDDRHPVVCVTFRDAQDYAGWLSKKTGHTYRLLTEAEWEYAARAGTTTPYPWGETATHEASNYGGDERPGPGLAQGRDQWVGTSPVGAFPPNAFGLYDMNGNVMQWVQDCFSKNYAGLPTDGSAFEADGPVTGMTGNLSAMNGTSACSYRMLRGGDWGDPPSMIRSAFRNFAPSIGQSLATYRSAGLGIRVARD